MTHSDTDVLIIGAGLSGIGAAVHLGKKCPGLGYQIFEQRNAIGGTWDLFRYPGIRSDSDMHTLGYNFKPWTEAKAIADGPSIRKYVEDTADEYGITPHIRFNTKIVAANWSSEEQLWHVTHEDDLGARDVTTCRFLFMCGGYYRYDEGYRPDFPGEATYEGQFIHPQHWPEDLDYSGKKVVIIGSGATAMTLVPAMTDKAAHVTMLQRSPTYLMPLPSIDKVTLALQKVLPEKVAYRLTRARNISIARLLYERSRRSPKAMRRLLLAIIRRQLGGQVDMRHFSPDYNPWDQRLCVVKDGDLFQVLKSGRASIVTDRIERFTETGIRLASGTELEADLIVPATGLDLQMLGGVAVSVDGEPVVMKDKIIYKNVLVEGVPNAGMIFGYTNISWTLKVDIAAEYLCRLMNLMDRRGHQVVVARDTENSRGEETILGSLDAGYIKRAADRLPRQGTHGPWKSNQNYLEDVKVLRFEPIEDGYLEFDGVRTRVGQGRAAGVLAPLRSALFGT